MDDKMNSNNRRIAGSNDNPRNCDDKNNNSGRVVRKFFNDGVPSYEDKEPSQRMLSDGWRDVNDNEDQDVFFLKECFTGGVSPSNEVASNLLDSATDSSATSTQNYPISSNVPVADIFSDLAPLTPCLDDPFGLDEGCGDSVIGLEDDDEVYNEEDIDVIFQGVVPNKVDTSAPITSNTNHSHLNTTDKSNNLQMFSTTPEGLSKNDPTQFKSLGHDRTTMNITKNPIPTKTSPPLLGDLSGIGSALAGQYPLNKTIPTPPNAGYPQQAGQPVERVSSVAGFEGTRTNSTTTIVDSAAVPNSSLAFQQIESFLSPLNNPTHLKHSAKSTAETSTEFLKIFSAAKGASFMPWLSESNKSFVGGTTNASSLTNGNIMLPHMTTGPGFSGTSVGGMLSTQDASAMMEDEDDDVEADDHIKRLSTFSEYKPAKFNFGKPHPDQVVETSSMAVVEPPDIFYELQIVSDVLDTGSLSSLQLEAISYACQRHEILLECGERAAFFIGDGPGVGKGRIIAGIIHENKLCGREKAIWLSVSSDLRFDAIRDLADVHCNLNVIPLNKVTYNEYISDYEGYAEDGVLFCTYASLIGVCNSASSVFRSRLEQIVDWCGDDFDGVLVFDECHKAKNLIPVPGGKSTKTALAVLEIQKRLPNARVVYCSATGATEPKNLGYMYRLGLWGEGTPFAQLGDFIRAVEKRGVGGMEIVAMDMKLRGMYIARQLSFQGVTFRIYEVELAPKFKSVYNKSVLLWNKLLSYSEKAVNMCGISGKASMHFWAKFWSYHQRFFKYLCIASKVDSVVELVRSSLKNGKCVIIGLQSTGESHISENDCNLERIVSTASGVLVALVEKSFPVPTEFDSNGRSSAAAKNRIHSNNRQKLNSKLKRPTLHNPLLLVKSDDEDDFIDVDEDDVIIVDDDSDVDSDEIDSRSELIGGGYAQSKKVKFNNHPSPVGAAESEQMVENDDVLAAAGLPSCKYSWGTATNLTKAVAKETLELSPAQMCVRWRQELLDDIERLSSDLPANTLDELIDKLGGVKSVAEMTGRKGRIVKVRDDFYTYKSRGNDELPLEYVNISERSKFMGGEKLVAIISEAASAGISLQADKRCANQRKRVHITLELPWSADKAVQQFGRSHRSNQLYPPEYVFVISELAGEKRFASSVAKRLESLGALTHGDRRASETRDLSQYNFENKYGRMALHLMINCLNNRRLPPSVPLPSYVSQVKFFDDAIEALKNSGLSVFMRNALGGGSGYSTADTSSSGGFGDSSSKGATKISRFLNRLLGIQVDLQNSIFSLYASILSMIIKDQKKAGKWDSGILDWGVTGERVIIDDTAKFTIHSKSSDSTVELCQIFIERGYNWDEIGEICRSQVGPSVPNHHGEGFYAIDRFKHLRSVIFVKRVHTSALNSANKNLTTPTNSESIADQPDPNQLYSVFRPNLGESAKTETLENIQKRYSMIDTDSAEQLWNTQYHSSLNLCTHLFRWGKCSSVSRRAQCDHGKRRKVVHVLSGAIFGIWNIVETVFGDAQVRIVRVSTCAGDRKVGIIVQNHLVDILKSKLHQAGTDSFKTTKMKT